MCTCVSQWTATGGDAGGHDDNDNDDNDNDDDEQRGKTTERYRVHRINDLRPPINETPSNDEARNSKHQSSLSAISPSCRVHRHDGLTLVVSGRHVDSLVGFGFGESCKKDAVFVRRCFVGFVGEGNQERERANNDDKDRW